MNEDKGHSNMGGSGLLRPPNGEREQLRACVCLRGEFREGFNFWSGF